MVYITFFKKVALLFSAFTVLLFASCQQQPVPYLSNLQATANSPLYTTYAAAMERSEYALDEGYELLFNDPERGIELTTDTGGDIVLGFRVNGKWICALKDMYQAPVITRSYPDLVTYHYYPVAGLRADVTFLVQSSHTALLDIKLTNEGKQQVDFELVPFIKNTYRTFNKVNYQPNNNCFTFDHDEFADGWTRTHDIPYVEYLSNVFMLSECSDAQGVFNSLAGEAVLPPFDTCRNKASVYRVNGRSKAADGERNTVLAPQSRLQIYLNNKPDRLITENSPVWGENQAVIAKGGYFTNELGLLGAVNNGTAFTLKFYSEANNTSGEYTHTVKEAASNKSMRNDVTLTPYKGPSIPQNLTVELVNTGITAELKWDAGTNVKHYNIYRRNYQNGYYERMGSTAEPHFTDSSLEQGATYGYIVTATNPQGETSIHSREVSTLPCVSFASFTTSGQVPTTNLNNMARLISFHRAVKLAAGEEKSLRLIRTVERAENDLSKAIDSSKQLMAQNLQPYINYNEQLFAKAPAVQFNNPDKEMLYWSAFNMMRQQFLPPEGKSKYNYYVFSREPTWGWGHGGQVFHESITMLAYALLDPQSAMNSQRVYQQRQYESGYINYRTGSYLDEIIEYEGKLTSSAPWYAWQNWEVYKISKDKVFLKDMYESSKRFYNFYVQHRDVDGDGLCEWNGHAVLESVRDALVAVWDEVGWPSNFEGVDVNSMLVMEAKSLEQMATELGLTAEAEGWKADWSKRADLINSTFWDAETGFYYNVDRKKNSFTYEHANDLKRKEIIGFLPLWAGIVPQDRVAPLLEHLFNPNEFWRKYGVPTLSADDPYYNHKGYWNGPVWVEWDLFIMQGLQQYGYHKQAKELVDRVAENMILQLKKDHNLWEFYSPDEQWAGYHKTYIWGGIINKMMLDSMIE